MIKIEITITDTPIGEGKNYVKIEVMPELIEPVNRHELGLRDLIMDKLSQLGEDCARLEGVEQTYMAKVPIKKKGKDVNTGDNRRNPGTLR